MSIELLQTALREACDAAGSQVAWSFPRGIAQSHVSEVLNGKAPPSDAVLEALGFERFVEYVPAGTVAKRWATREAILADARDVAASRQKGGSFKSNLIAELLRLADPQTQEA